MEESLYETKSFFILSGLRKGSEFGIDGGPTYTVDRFEGVKFVPAGLHLFIFSSQQSPSTSSNAAGESEAVSNGVGIRCGLFRFFDDQREVVVEAWDNQREELEGDESRRVRRSENYVVEEGERTIISVDRLKALDSHLMPYPIENQVAWQHLVKFVTRNTLLRVLGVDQKGNFRADSIMSGSDEPELKEVRSQTSWGKARERDPMMGEERAEDDEDEQALEFMNVDKKRSWPSDASGAELSRWSIDKSYQLSNMISILGIGTSAGVKELFGEIQISFILFTLLHNFSALASYKSFFALICRSASLLLPLSSRHPSSYSSTLLTSESLPLFATFLSILHDQFTSLDPSVFSTQMPSLESFFLDELDGLCRALSDASTEWNALSAQNDGAGGEVNETVWRYTIERYNDLAALTMTRFGWSLGMIKGSRKHGYGQDIVVGENEVDFEDLEEGEDRPVIVEL